MMILSFGRGGHRSAFDVLMAAILQACATLDVLHPDLLAPARTPADSPQRSGSQVSSGKAMQRHGERECARRRRQMARLQARQA